MKPHKILSYIPYTEYMMNFAMIELRNAYKKPLSGLNRANMVFPGEPSNQIISTVSCIIYITDRIFLEKLP